MDGGVGDGHEGEDDEQRLRHTAGQASGRGSGRPQASYAAS